MTVRIEKHYQDDLGGAGSATPVRFSVEGVEYEVHLNKRNRETFLRRLGVYVDVAHPVEQHRAPRNPNAPAIRKWAAERGMTVSERGRIPQEIVDAYHADQGK